MISRNGDITWPPRSPELTMCVFLLGYVKSKVFQDNSPQTFQALKQRIWQEVDQIPLAILLNLINNFRSRLEKCMSKQASSSRSYLQKIKLFIPFLCSLTKLKFFL